MTKTVPTGIRDPLSHHNGLPVTSHRFIGGNQEGDHLIISVSDTGKGIPEDELPTIFDEYRQVKGSDSAVQKGTGLGLSITKKFAELLGGTIRVEGEEGKGSTFTVNIPVDYIEEREKWCEGG